MSGATSPNTNTKFLVSFTLDADLEPGLIEEILQEALSPISISVRKGSLTKSRLSADDKEQVVSLRKDGLTYKELAYKFGCSKVVINKILRAAGLTKAWSRKANVQIVHEEAEQRAAEDFGSPTQADLAMIDQEV